MTDSIAWLATIFAAAGCGPAEHERIAHYLVQANLVGHDSHGVIRAPTYIEWLRAGKVLANQAMKIVFENDAMAVVDGQFGFGQVMGEEAMKLGIEKAGRQGVAVVALRNSGHLGRIGDWAELAARAGKVSLHFVNTNGGGILAAPFGGTQRRLSANPIAAGVPVSNGPPIILDISTCMIAEGKIKVAFNKGVTVPDGCILDGEGRPTNDPNVFYASPPGAILPFGGHKGYSLSVIADVLAGALTGGALQPTSGSTVSPTTCSASFSTPHSFNQRMDSPARLVTSSPTSRARRRWRRTARSSCPASPRRTRAKRLRDGIELDDKTWNQIVATCQSLGVVAIPVAESPTS